MKPTASDASKAIGVVTQDPTTKMPIGGKIQIEAVGINYEGQHSSGRLEDWHSFNGILLSVWFSNVYEHRIEGSAVLVAPGVAICVRHVVDPALSSIMSGDEAIMCFGITPNGLQIWRVRKITQVPSSDLALLGLELASEFGDGETLFISKLTTRLPTEGAELLLSGFQAASMTFPRESTQFGGSVLVSKGPVMARYPLGRDRGMMPWPCLEVGCASWGGMSGGPVYDQHGMLVGVLSSSFSDGPSYVSLIWPALTARFEGGWPASLFEGATRLIDLDPRLCAIDRRDALQVTVDSETGVQRTHYHIWE